MQDSNHENLLATKEIKEDEQSDSRFYQSFIHCESFIEEKDQNIQYAPEFIPQSPITQTNVQNNQRTKFQKQIIDSRFPVKIICPCCQRQTKTNVQFKMGKGSWICVAYLGLLFLIMCWLPCYSEEFQDAYHFCTRCKAEIGRCPYKACN